MSPKTNRKLAAGTISGDPGSLYVNMSTQKMQEKSFMGLKWICFEYLAFLNLALGKPAWQIGDYNPSTRANKAVNGIAGTGRQADCTIGNGLGVCDIFTHQFWTTKNLFCSKLYVILYALLFMFFFLLSSFLFNRIKCISFK